MLRGHTTNDRYEECLKGGFCKYHLKELEIKEDFDGYELQRRAMLYIRLQIFAPLLFNKPFSSEKLKTLFAKSKCFPDKLEKEKDFKEAIMVLDSVVVYTLCYFSQVCCAGALYKSSKEKSDPDPVKQRILQLLTKGILEESDISYFNPILKENFTDFDKNLIKVSYVTALLYVRNMTMNLKLGLALTRLENELRTISREGEKWIIIGNDSYKEKRFDEAVTAYTSAIYFNPYNVPLLENRARAFLTLKQFGSAALDYYIALVLSPFSLKSYCRLSYSLFQYKLYYESYVVAEFAIDKFKDCEHTSPKLYEYFKRMRDVSKKYNERTFPIACQTSTETETNVFSEELDIPDLIEASDSENEIEDVPDLMDASDSEDSGSDSRVLTKKSNIGKNENESPVVGIQDIELCYKDEKQEKRDNLRSSLKEASNTLLNGRSLLSVPHYQKALNELKMYPEVHNYEDSDIMCIKYAYGCALCRSKEYDDLLKAVNVFKDISEEHNALMFPAAHYGIGLAYYKLNWFKDALGHFKTVIEILQRDIQFRVYTWPELTTEIEETKPEHLKVLVNNLIKECENPPPPNAVCRFDKCSLRASIYLTDPDFKGFYFVLCSEQCCLQYHPQCWKILRSLKQCSDKAFLEQKCFTPDCEGVICKIQNVCREGNVEKMFSLADTKKLAKQKRVKVGKKSEIKEEKKRKRKDSTSKSESTSEATDEISCDNLVEVEVNSNSREPKFDAMPEVYEKSEDINPSCSQLSAVAEPFIMLKKEKLVDEHPSKVSVKPKEHKKVKTNTLTIDEFLKNNPTSRVENISFEVESCNHNTLETKTSSSALPSSSDAFNYAEKLLGVKKDLNASAPSFDPSMSHVIDCVKKEVYLYLKDLLQKHGPLRIDDPILIEELKDFPPVANKVISDYGGIGGFLKRHIDFALVGETYVCVVADVVAAYEKVSTDSIEIGKVNTVPSYPAYSVKEDVDNGFNSSYLNPDAKEYLPPSSSCASSESGSLDAVTENPNRNSPVLITAISKLRQPLAVDVENISEKNGVETSGGCKAKKLARNDSSYSSNGVPKDSSPQEKVAALIEKCTAYIIDVYCSEDMSEYHPYIEERMKPYSIEKVPKKSTSCVQTETNEVEKVSIGTMKTDEELERVKEITCYLTEDKKELQQRLKAIEKEHNAALSSVTKNHIESTTEFENLKKELADLKSILNDRKSEFEKRENILVTENARLLERLKKTEDVYSNQKSELDEILKSNDSMKNKLKEMENIVNMLQNEKNLTKQSVDLQLEGLNNNIQTLAKENTQAIERAKYAEQLLLHLKKSDYLRRIDHRATEAVMRKKQLQEGISLVSTNNGNANPTFFKNMESFSSEITEYVKKLNEIRTRFMGQIDEQINQVNNGICLKEIKPIEIGDIPGVPSRPTAGLTAQVPYWGPQILLLSGAGLNTLSPGLVPRQPEPVNLPLCRPNPMLGTPSLNPVTNANNSSAVTPIINRLAPSAQGPFTAFNRPIVKPPVVDLKPEQAQTEVKAESSLLKAASKDSLASAATADSSDARSSEKGAASSTYELSYTVKKNEAKVPVLVAVSQENINREPKNSYEKLLHKLYQKFPEYTQSQLMDFVKEFREKRSGKLSGLSMESIISHVRLIIESKKKIMVPDEGIRNRPSPPVLVNKKLVLDETKTKKLSAESGAPKKCPWGKSDEDTMKQWSGNNIEDGCIICYEDMSKNPYRVDCGHCFHLQCIRKWLTKKSDCPICRVHLLLPDDYPVLK